MKQPQHLTGAAGEQLSFLPPAPFAPTWPQRGTLADRALGMCRNLPRWPAPRAHQWPPVLACSWHPCRAGGGLMLAAVLYLAQRWRCWRAGR